MLSFYILKILWQIFEIDINFLRVLKLWKFLMSISSFCQIGFNKYVANAYLNTGGKNAKLILIFGSFKTLEIFNVDFKFLPTLIFKICCQFRFETWVVKY